MRTIKVELTESEARALLACVDGGPVSPDDDQAWHLTQRAADRLRVAMVARGGTVADTGPMPTPMPFQQAARLYEAAVSMELGS